MKKESKSDDEHRRLTYLFLTLPYPERMEIIVKLNLLEDGDERLGEVEAHRILFQRAEEQGKLCKLWDSVVSQHSSLGNSVVSQHSSLGNIDPYEMVPVGWRCPVNQYTVVSFCLPGGKGLRRFMVKIKYDNCPPKQDYSTTRRYMHVLADYFQEKKRIKEPIKSIPENEGRI